MVEEFLVHQFLLDHGFDDGKQAQMRGATEDLVHVIATLKLLAPRFVRIASALEMILETLDKAK